MINNRHNLPQAFVNLFGQRQYSRGRSHWSVTQLISPPKIAVLREEHAAAIAEEADLSDQFWALMGSNIHKILESGAGDDTVVEERIFTEIKGVTISGAIDVQRHTGGKVGIIDWKFTSVYSVTRPKPEWEQQLNLYAYLLQREKGSQIDSLQVCAILRDWRKTDMERRKEYPPAPVVMVDLPLWTYEAQHAFMMDRVEGLLQASAKMNLGIEMPRCSDEDRWLRDGEPIRCRNYCDVSRWCSQWQEWKTEKEKENEYDLPRGERSISRVKPEGADPAVEPASRGARGRPRRKGGKADVVPKPVGPTVQEQPAQSSQTSVSKEGGD